MREYRLHRLIAAEQPAFGAILAFASVDVMELIGLAGFDFVMIDCQHGPMTPDSVLPLVRIAEAADMAPLVRLPSCRPDEALRYLDVGAAGIIVPSVGSRADAEAAVATVRYPPEGVRAFAPAVRAAGFGLNLDLPAYVERVHERAIVIPIIETVDGVQSVDAILSVEGVTGIAIGTVDLAMDMGLRGNSKDPRIVQIKHELLDVCQRHGKPALTAGADRDQLTTEIEGGARMVMVPFSTWMAAASREMIRGLRAE